MIIDSEQPAPRTYSRRSVLKGTAVGGGAVALASVAGIGYRSEDNGVWNSGSGKPYELWDGWQEVPGHGAIVAAGILAANPHNTQPWTFTVDGDTIDVAPDDSRSMPRTDADAREHIAGLGCAAENMVIAARGRGLDSAIDLWPAPDVAVRITLAPGPTATERETALADAIARRHTNRGPYSPTTVSSDDLARLTDADAGAASVRWVTDPIAVAQLGSLYVDATQAIIDDEESSIEGFSWFRSTRADIEKYRDGLTLDAQGLDSLTLAAAKILPATSRTSGDKFWLKSTREVHTATAAAYGIITVPHVQDATDRINGGRLLEHVHVAATADGLALHHMNQVTERIARDAALGDPDAFGARWEAAVGVPAQSTLVSFRIGHPHRAPRRSPRRAVESVLVGM